MTDSDKRISLHDERSDTAEGRFSLAAAKLALRVAGLLNLARERAGFSNRELASRLSLSEGRVSQVLNGDGNLHVATVGRFMRACGYELALTARAVEPGVSDIVPTRRIPIREASNWGMLQSHLRFSEVSHMSHPSGVGHRGPFMLRSRESTPWGEAFFWAVHYHATADVILAAESWPQKTAEAVASEDPRDRVACGS